MSALIPFLYEATSVRVAEISGEPWFVAADVCEVLELKNPRQAITILEEDERGVTTMDTLGGPQELNIISESGLYALIFRSRKPSARYFRKWVTSEVLPAIRKTGRYEVKAGPQVHVVGSMTISAEDYAALKVAEALQAAQNARRRKTRPNVTPERARMVLTQFRQGVPVESIAALLDISVEACRLLIWHAQEMARIEAEAQANLSETEAPNA